MRRLALTCVLCCKLVLVLCFSVVDSELYEGDACTGNQGEAGVCRSAHDCPSIAQMIKKRVRPVHCSWSSAGPIICCPPSPSRPTNRKSSTPLPTTPTTTTTTTTRSPPTTPQSRITSRVNPTNGNAAKMCLEYARYVYVEVQEPTLLLEDETNVRNESTCVSVAQELIVGGEVAGPREFPHMVALGYGERDRIIWQCGGTLISNKFVLTAAHCLSARGSGDVRWARLGDLNLQGAFDDENAITVEVNRTIRHEGYKPPAHYNDIALIELKDKVTFSPDVRPACLRTEDEDPPAEHAVIATGWGKNDSANEEGTNNLMKVELSILSPETCNRTLRSTVGKKELRQGVTPDTMICAGNLEEAKDTCQGDSGGPLQFLLETPYCMYSIIGLTSFGSTGCGIGLSASVYTRVSNYIGWIESHVWP